MRPIVRTSTTAVLVLAACLAGCGSEDGPAERAGETIDEAAEDGDEAIDDAADDLEDAVDDVGEGLEDGGEDG